MKNWKVNKRHGIYEEVLGITINDATEDEAREILEYYGFTVVEVNNILNIITVIS